MTDKELDELRQRNEQRAIAFREKMGEKWLLHPANRITKKKWKAFLRNSNKKLT